MIAVVVPTIRPESMSRFKKAWSELFTFHDVQLVTVWDGKKPTVEHKENTYTVKQIMGDDEDLIYNFNDGIRNLGFAYVAQFVPEAEYIITLDDDVEPCGDTIQDHINALHMNVPIRWISTASEYMRGFPYRIRNEAEVVLSHGVWNGVKDWDAPTQLVRGNPDVTFYKGPIPKNILFPMCIMNVAFKRKILNIMYQAPMGPKVGVDRFGDIWGGIEVKKDIDAYNVAAVTGFARVEHTRASNVYSNLIKEAKGIGMNEKYGEDEYFKLFIEKRNRWIEFINPFLL
mgnify:CR=1 FL=1